MIVCAEDAEASPFAGWLALLRAGGKFTPGAGGEEERGYNFARTFCVTAA
jgi:hypothetical protein